MFRIADNSSTSRPDALIRLRLEDRKGSEGDRKHTDVVLLPELLRRGSNLLGGLMANGLRALEAEEFAVGVLRFNDAIGHQGERIARIELQCGFGIVGVGDDT